MYIDCLWVSGKFKGQGYSNLLLEECIKDSKEKGKLGLVILSSKKKMGFLSDPQFLEHKGFTLTDTAEPYYQLMYLPFGETAAKPHFKPLVKTSNVEKPGFVLYYAHQCPFTAKYVPLIKTFAKAKGVELHTVRYETTEQAQNAPVPSTSYSLFYNGEFITHEILSEKKFEKICTEKGL